MGAFILEPVNTWTNLVFIVAGLVFFFRANGFLSERNRISSHLMFPRLYGFALFTVGAGSFFLHASETFAGQWFDVFGMYLVSTFFIAYNAYRIGALTRQTFLAAYFGICIFLGGVIFVLPESRRYLFGISILVILVQSILTQRKMKTWIQRGYLYAALGAYVLAQSVWYLDKSGLWCNPYSWMNGHGLWHIFTGASAVLIYFYFHSEKAESRS